MPETDAYHYLSGARGAVGPLGAQALRKLRARQVIADATLVRQGEGPWLAFADHPALRPAAPGTLAEADGVRRYPVHLSTRWTFTGVAVVMGSLLGWMGLLPFRSTQIHFGGSPFLWAAIFWGFAAFLVVVAWDAWTSFVVLSPNRVGKRSLFGTILLRFDEIVGYRIGPNGRALLLVAQEPRRNLKIPITSSGHAELTAWAQEHFTNLTGAELAAATEKLLDDERLGGTREQRAARLAWARKVTLWVGVGVTAVSAFGISPLLPSSFLIPSIFAPLAPLLLLAIFRGYVTFEGTASDPRAKLAPLLLPPLLVLASRAGRDVQPLSTGWAIPCMILAVLGTMLLRHSGTSRSPWVVCSVFLLCLLGGYGLIMESDILFDSGPAESHPVTVISSRESHGSRSTSKYHICVSGWPEHPACVTFLTQRAASLSIRRNDAATVLVHPGFWRVPWAELVLDPSRDPAPLPRGSN